MALAKRIAALGKRMVAESPSSSRFIKEDVEDRKASTRRVCEMRYRLILRAMNSGQAHNSLIKSVT